MVETQGASAIPIEGVEAHQMLVGAFTQGILAQEALSIANRSGVVALRFVQLGQRLQGMGITFFQPCPCGKRPFLVTVA
jgi:hypothetical protein